MTDLPPSWRPDPTGRHDHRYWDGSRWTDHVADAGVAATDPLEVPAANAVAPQEEAIAPAGPTPTAVAPEPGATPADAPTPEVGTPDAPTAEAAAPDPSTTELPTADAPTTEIPATDPSSADAPTAELPTAEEPTAEEPTTELPTAEEPTAEEPTAELPTEGAAAPAPTDPTVVTSTWSDPTLVVPAASVPPTGADPGLVGDHPTEPVAAAAETGAGAGGGGVPKLVIGIAVVAVLAVVLGVVLLASGGGSSTSDASTAASKIAASLRTDDHLSAKDADCVGNAVVAKLGAARLKGVDFTSATPPKGLEKDFSSALGDAIIHCHIDVSALGGSTSSTSTTTGIDLGNLGDISSYKQLLTNVYEQSFGLPQDKASCLAGAMTDAISKGNVSQSQAQSSTFFTDFLDHCHISLDDLDHTPTSG